ncbi:hypothetical protein ROZALSC1DRAFT_28534, partial [Rozella allomycis CSF55]
LAEELVPKKEVITKDLNLDNLKFKKRKPPADASSTPKVAKTKATPSNKKDTQHAPVGSLIAAKTFDADQGQDLWILATVLSYEIEDAEELDDDSSEKLEKKKIPLSDQDALVNEFHQNDTVLALFPQTTCFYEASVVTPPSKRKKSHDYVLIFDDDEGENGGLVKRNVSAKYVLKKPT